MLLSYFSPALSAARFVSFFPDRQVSPRGGIGLASGKRCAAGRAVGDAAPMEAYLGVRRGGALPLPWAGKSAKRRQWRKKRAGFEEVPRLAGTTVPGNRLARRWAGEPRPYGWQEVCASPGGASRTPPPTDAVRDWAGDREGRPYGKSLCRAACPHAAAMAQGLSALIKRYTFII